MAVLLSSVPSYSNIWSVPVLTKSVVVAYITLFSGSLSRLYGKSVVARVSRIFSVVMS